MRDCLLNCLLDPKIRYVSIPRSIYNWYKNTGKKYTFLTLEDVKNKYRKSDTIFILGSGESINDVTEEQWSHIVRHDSFAINKWPVHPFVPTFYYTNYPRKRKHIDSYLKSINSGIKRYNRTIFFLSFNRVVTRGMHPRIFPEFFSDNPVCCFYEYVAPIRLRRGQFFDVKSFAKTLYYRGALSLVLDLVNKMFYKNIILMGVDLKNAMHFYDVYFQMQWQFQGDYSIPLEERRNKKHATMETKNGTKMPMDQYIYAVNELYFKPKGIKIFVSSEKSMLAERIPIYQFSD